MDWRNRSACLDESPEMFFPVGSTGLAHVQIAQAKAVCRRCEVAGACLRWAIDTRQDTGIWGGLSDHERRALRLGRGEVRASRAG